MKIAGWLLLIYVRNYVEWFNLSFPPLSLVFFLMSWRTEAKLNETSISEWNFILYWSKQLQHRIINKSPDVNIIFTFCVILCNFLSAYNFFFAYSAKLTCIIYWFIFVQPEYFSFKMFCQDSVPVHKKLIFEPVFLYRQHLHSTLTITLNTLIKIFDKYQINFDK